MKKVLKDDLPNLAREVLAKLPAKDTRAGRATLITLSGDLGAGKTSFVQALARELGVTEAIQSPTYVLMKKYELVGQRFRTLIHIDAYRLKDMGEFAVLRPEEFFGDESALVALEWPEMVEGALPKADIAMKLSSEGAGEGERYISADPE